MPTLNPITGENVDIVRPLVIEDGVEGTEEDIDKKRAEPNEDFVFTKGVFIGESKDKVIGEKDGEIAFYDPINNVKKISEISSGGGLTENSHRILDQLVHDIVENSYTEYTYLLNKVVDMIIWTDSNKTLKIREENYSYLGNDLIQIITKQYDSLGVLKETYTETFNYTGNRITDSTGVYI